MGDFTKLFSFPTGKEIYDVAAPILKGQLGVFRIGFSRDIITETIYHIITYIIIVTFSIMLAGIFVFAVFSRTVTRPLEKLSKTAEPSGGDG